MMEAIEMCERISGNRLNHVLSDQNRVGDHIWWVSDISAFQADYPDYRLQYDIAATLQDIHDAGKARWTRNG